MNKHFFVAVFTSFVGLIALNVGTPRLYADDSKAAVIMHCTGNPYLTGIGRGFTVDLYDASAGAPPGIRPVDPATNTGTPCATALKILFDDGFVIEDVKADGGNAIQVLYTLVRPAGLATSK